MILIKLAKNKNKTIKEAYGKYYARPVVTETIGIDELAEHMASHNTPFSKGAIKGLLTDMVSCVKELVLQNKAVKIDNLAIFSIGIINKMGAASIKEWSLAKFVYAGSAAYRIGYIAVLWRQENSGPHEGTWQGYQVVKGRNE